MKVLYYDHIINFLSMSEPSNRVGYYLYTWLSSNGTVTTLNFTHPNPLGCKVLKVKEVM